MVEGLTDAHRAPYLVGGLAAGSAWQVLYRRDLADRLVFPVVLALVTLGWALVRGAPIEVSEDTVGPEATLLYLGGLLAALVLTEQHLRRRDHRDDRGAQRGSTCEEPRKRSTLIRNATRVGFSRGTR
ncbi:hypothetical protein [Nocardioides convexus]|uniref:hypothetical protein n=1 Tax=Nocardioides convexus TaxID=2712224 RepID=UPI0024183668|nr:hypothetical protein [Nocardioides convexus]